MGLVLWEIITRETPTGQQLRELRTPAECPEVRLCVLLVGKIRLCKVRTVSARGAHKRGRRRDRCMVQPAVRATSCTAHAEPQLRVRFRSEVQAAYALATAIMMPLEERQQTPVCCWACRRYHSSSASACTRKPTGGPVQRRSSHGWRRPDVIRVGGDPCPPTAAGG